jgi:UDP-2,3-diacylglucosamine hydrolase
LGPLPLPADHGRLDAPAAWRAIDIISDLHLDERHPRTFDAWRQFLLHTQADAVFLLGDIFEAWVGDDARHEGFERECAAVLREAAEQRWLGFMPGNRDFLVGDALLVDCGMHRLADPTLLVAFDRRVLLTHGDALCLADTDYQRFRAMVRNPAWQQTVLARPLAERRALARQMRHASETAMSEGGAAASLVDVDPAAASAWLHETAAAEMVHGHTHRPDTSGALGAGLQRHVLSDWDLDDAAHPRAEVLRLSADGWQRLRPERAASPQ